jgi:hypothetical protein
MITNGSSPNPRLQRTPLRAPLSRKPFGDFACLFPPWSEQATICPNLERK